MTTFTGSGIWWYRAVVLKSALGLLSKGITPTRGVTRKKALTMATEYTGCVYVRSIAGLELAVTDLQAWIEANR